MPFASPRRRSRRAHEWTRTKAVTFIVTLARTRNVTLAARASGMSRKSAYALKSRDAAFASAWAEALKGPVLSLSKDRKAEQMDGAPVSPLEGNRRNRATPSTDSTSATQLALRRADEALRDAFFARLRDSAALAPRPAAQ